MKRKRFFSVIAIAAIVGLGVISCKKDVTGVTLDQTTATLVVGKSLTLTATVSPEKAANKNVKWLSDNESVAIVNNGIVNAISEGEATITVITEDGGKTASCLVTVISPPIDTVTKKKMTITISLPYNVEFEFAGTDTMTIDWGDKSDIETYILSSTPLKYKHTYSSSKDITITITGKNVSYFNLNKYYNIRSLNVSENTALTEFYCNENSSLSKIDVSKNIYLKKLSCLSCGFVNIDVSKNIKLIELYCDFNYLTNLDVSKNIKLTALKCSDNKLSADALNAIFEALPNTKGTIVIGGNPGTSNCNKSIAEGKGWIVKNY